MQKNSGVSAGIVKKIDKEFLERGTREEFLQSILELLNLVQAQVQRNTQLDKRVLDLENEVRRLKGEKKARVPAGPRI